MQTILVAHSELALKGRNRKEYEQKLKKSISRAANYSHLEIKSFKNNCSQFIYEIENSKEEIIEVFSKIFGIKYFSFIEKLPKTMPSLKDYITKELKIVKEEGVKEISFDTKRADKTFGKSSPEINAQLGELAKNLGIAVNYRQKKSILYIKVLQTPEILVSSKRYSGLSGLPSGATGKMLVLLSGGIDSPAAAFKMMSRGIVCDFLHLHDLRNKEALENSKIPKVIRKLNQYQLKKSKLYHLPQFIYHLHTKTKIYDNFTTVYFKHYILQIADYIAKKEGYLGIITGDSLAQVASQTPENLILSSSAISTPIYRPFCGSDKEEIIELSKAAGLYELSIEQYKDCCAIISTANPILKAKPEKYKRATRFVDKEKLFEESKKNIGELLV